MSQAEMAFATKSEQLSCVGACSNLCLELTGLTICLSSQLGLPKHTQFFLNNQLLPAIQVGRYTS
jgi:hypothetical protein